MNTRSLFAKLEHSLGQIAGTADVGELLAEVLRRLVDDFREDLDLESGRLYVVENDGLHLHTCYPDSERNRDFHIPTDYRPVRELLCQGYVLHDHDDPGLDHKIEDALGVKTFAAILVGDIRRHVISLSLRKDSDREQTVRILNTVRYVINLTLRARHYRDNIEQVRQIQHSLLPRVAPKFPGYTVWGRAVSAEEVGGDLYDFFQVSDRSLAITIADAAGHGLPAALQARDAIIGLRMGSEERLRITTTLQKLNRVIAHAGLASRFISMFYCEIEANGTLVYCNAGHNPPLLLRKGKLHELSTGGMVLGPNPDARYERGYMHMTGYSIVLMYTDGIVEAEDANGEMFGLDRLRRLLTEETWSDAESLVERVFADVRAFAMADPPTDDQTVVAIVHPGEDNETD